MADIHAAAFVQQRGWSAAEFTDLLAQPHTKSFVAPQGFALTRTLAAESELLTLAVSPPYQRRGIARGLVLKWLEDVQDHAETAFLEVAADNAPARALYQSLGFAQNGLRKAYYARPGHSAVDAMLMMRALTRG